MGLRLSGDKEKAELREQVVGRSVMAKRLVVVGGGAGGPSAAAKAKRVNPDLEVTIVESGEHVSFSA